MPMIMKMRMRRKLERLDKYQFLGMRRDRLHKIQRNPNIKHQLILMSELH